MTDDFKKARDEYLIDLYGANVPHFNEGADWAYEWLVKDRFINPVKKQIDCYEKLAIAVEALEKIAKREYPMAEQALAKIKGESE